MEETSNETVVNLKNRNEKEKIRYKKEKCFF